MHIRFLNNILEFCVCRVLTYRVSNIESGTSGGVPVAIDNAARIRAGPHRTSSGTGGNWRQQETL